MVFDGEKETGRPRGGFAGVMAPSLVPVSLLCGAGSLAIGLVIG